MGRRAFAHKRSTFPGVSSPWRVVRSMQVIARSSHAACHSFFTVRRVGIVAALRSTALRLTRSSRMMSRSRGRPELRSDPLGLGTADTTPRKRSDVVFMLAGECESRLEKSTRGGDCGPPGAAEIGRASCREKGEISVVAGSLKKKKNTTCVCRAYWEVGGWMRWRHVLSLL